MNREYHNWHSPRLTRDMELLWFGHAGPPVIVFPTSMGKFFEFEDRGMIDAAADRIDAGKVQFVCVDGIDRESWYNKSAHPRLRVHRHNTYEQYVIQEVIPLIRSRFPFPELGVAGCSFGGFHAFNFAMRHPDLVTHCVSMSGAFDIRNFLSGHYDQDAYFNNPVDYVPNLSDAWYFEHYRRMKIVLATSDWDICLPDNQNMSKILNNKGIAHWFDCWGDQSKHDWPLWQRMLRKFFE